VKNLLIRFALWRAEMGRKLDQYPFWREVVGFCQGLSLPVVGIAQATLRIFPFLRRLEWLLEIQALSRRHPVVLVLSLGFVLWRGLMKTPLGHIATDRAIYPFIGMMSGYNPFLGLLCGVAYGVGDLAQKFVWPDIYGARRWGDLNYWGAMVGYVVAYSSLMLMGLLPGMTSRVCRAAAGGILRRVIRRRATAMADGADPLGPLPNPAIEIAAAAAGSFAAGWAIMHEVAPLTERPAFYWRPNPDVSCHHLEVNTHLKGAAPNGGAGAAAGGAIGVAIPPPPPASAPPSAPELPDEFEWTAPNGVTYVVKKNEQGQYINILTGGEVDVTNLDAWKQSWSTIIQDHRQWADEQTQKLINRDTAFDRAMDQWTAEQKIRDKIWDNLSKMEKGILFGSGPESHLYKPPGEPGNILDHIRDLKDQIGKGKSVDWDKYDRIYKVYRDQKEGKILTPGQVPTPDGWGKIIGDTIWNSGKELVTGQTADGQTSWWGIGGRTVIGIATGGASELVFIPANAVNSMKEYVDKGGDSALEGFTEAAKGVIRDELIGKGVGAALKGGMAVGGALTSAAGEVIEEAAKRGNSIAKGLLNAGGAAKNGLKGIGKVLNAPVGTKPPNLSTVAKAPKTPIPPDPGRIARDAKRAGSTNLTTSKAGVPPGSLEGGFSPNAVKHAKVVADKYGVVIDVRPTNVHSGPLIQSGKAVPKPGFIKNKTLTEADRLLGAKGPPGTVGMYKPKLPPQGNMSDEAYAKLKKLYNQRLSEFNEEFAHLKELRNQGKVYVKDGVIHDAKTGKPFAGDIDIFDIRDPVTGKPIPRYTLDHKGNLIIDPATGQPKLNPVREQIIKDLKKPPFSAQHGAHMDWKYDHLDPGEAAHCGKIDAGVIGKHQVGGEPLISYGPNGAAETIYIQGGR